MFFIEQSALDFTGIDPWHPFREAVTEEQALGVLTEAQKEAFAEIKGDDFEFPQRGFGRRGQRGGDDGVDGDRPRRRRGPPQRDAG